MNSETVYFQSGEFGNFAIQIDGLDRLMKFLKESEPLIQQAMKDGLKEAVQPVLKSAKSKAQTIADDGTFAASLTVASRKNGANWVLKSTDPTAGVKEFARLGAKTITSKGTKLADARLAKRSGVGVPMRAYAPRAMVPAVNENTDLVKERIDAAIARVLESRNG